MGRPQTPRKTTPRSPGKGQRGSAPSEEFQIDILNRAAWQLEDAICGQTVTQYPGYIEAARACHFEVVKAEGRYNKALLGLVAITFLEVPAWCDVGVNTWLWLDGADRCRAPGGALIYLSGVAYIPPNVGILLEAVCFFLINYKFRLQRRLQESFFNRVEVEYVDLPSVKFGQWCVYLGCADLAFFLFIRPHYRFAFIFRTGLLCLLPAVRNLANIILQALSEFVSVAVFLVATIAFFAWIAVTIFDDMSEMNDDGVKVNTGLDSLSNALNTMFVAGATDDFVSCFLPSYTAFRMSGMLWLLFLVIVQVLLLNLVLDTLVAAYTRHAEVAGEESANVQVRGILDAWETLTIIAPSSESSNVEEKAPYGATQPPPVQQQSKEIDKQTFLQFISVLSDSPKLNRIPRHAAEVVFAAVDEDGSDLISKDEFCKICSVIQSQFWITPRDSRLKEKYPKFWNNPCYAWVRSKVWDEPKSSWNFDAVMNCVLGVNFVLVLVESRYDLMNWPQAWWMNYAELTFSILYVCEVLTRLATFSFASYWSVRANHFDFLTTWLLLCTSVMNFAAAEFAGSLSRYANILRLLRLLRVLKQLKSQPTVTAMINTIVRMVTASREILTLLAVVVFAFASLSVQLFGGLVYDANPRLEGTELLETKWTIFNFNDIIQALALWVVMLMCEYVPCFADAVHMISDIPYSWTLFPLFYLLGVSIMFELVKAFTIEIFIEIHKEGEEKKRKGEEEEEKSEAMKMIEESFRQNCQVLHIRQTIDSLEEERLEKAFAHVLGKHEGHEGHEGHGENGGHEGHGEGKREENGH